MSTPTSHFHLEQLTNKQHANTVLVALSISIMSSSSAIKRKAGPADLIDLTTESKALKRSVSCISALRYKDILGPKAKPLSYFNHVFGTVSLLYCMVSFLYTPTRAAVLQLAKMYSSRSKSVQFWSNCIFGANLIRHPLMPTKLPLRIQNNSLLIHNDVFSLDIPLKLDRDNLCISYRNLIRRHAVKGKSIRSFKSIILNAEAYPIRISHMDSWSTSHNCFNSKRYKNQLEMAGNILTSVKNQAVLLCLDWRVNLSLERMFPTETHRKSFQPHTLGIIMHQTENEYYRANSIIFPTVKNLVVFILHDSSTNINTIVNIWLQMCSKVENVYIYLARDSFTAMADMGQISTQFQLTVRIPEHETLKNLNISARHHKIMQVESHKGEESKVAVTIRDRHKYEQQYQVTGFLGDLGLAWHRNQNKQPVPFDQPLLDFKQEVTDTLYAHFDYRLIPGLFHQLA